MLRRNGGFIIYSLQKVRLSVAHSVQYKVELIYFFFFQPPKAAAGSQLSYNNRDFHRAKKFPPWLETEDRVAFLILMGGTSTIFQGNFYATLPFCLWKKQYLCFGYYTCSLTSCLSHIHSGISFSKGG